MGPKNRYEGKPLLRLLECYVLWAMGKLDDEQAKKLSEMEPKLQQVFKHHGNWREIVSAAVALPPNAPELIRAKWEENCKLEPRHPAILTPQEFAEAFVDTNLVN
jgi:hypothetical protein